MLLFCQTADAGLVSVGGGLTTGFDLTYREYKQEDDQGNSTGSRFDPTKYKRYFIKPFLDARANSVHSTNYIMLQPAWKYDFENASTDWDGDLILSTQYAPTARWDFQAQNSLQRSDSADNTTSTQTSADAPELSTDRSRTRYWRNHFSSDIGYSYGAHLHHNTGLGASYTILRNDDSGQANTDDYDRYQVRISSLTVVARQVQGSVDLKYNRGDFSNQDEEGNEESVDEYLAGLTGTYVASKVYKWEATYDLTLSRYHFSENDNTDVHQGRITLSATPASKWSGSLGFGPSYTRVVGSEPEYGGNGTLAVQYKSKHTTYGFNLDKEYDIENFSGNNKQGLVDGWYAGFTIGHQFSKSFSSDLDLSYSHVRRPQLSSSVLATDQTGNITDYTEETWSGQLSCGYNLSQSLRLNFSYQYSYRDSDLQGEDYDEHSLLITLSLPDNIFYRE